MKRESAIEKTVKFGALTMGVTSWKMNAAGERGKPDQMFLIPGGRPFFIEFKRPDGVLSMHQRVMIERLRHYGYDVEVHYEVQSALDAIKKRVLQSETI